MINVNSNKKYCLCIWVYILQLEQRPEQPHLQMHWDNFDQIKINNHCQCMQRMNTIDKDVELKDKDCPALKRC